ncbi:MAG: response regulator transcription factor [Piscinibacter sp.]|nr:response regulator transcription factor [Piscinibacter sp.]
MQTDASRITPRQHEVLSLIARARPNKRIADALSIAERTVALHVTALLDNLGARNRTQAVIKALQRGLPCSLPDEGGAPGTQHLHLSTNHNAGPLMNRIAALLLFIAHPRRLPDRSCRAGKPMQRRATVAKTSPAATSAGV